MAGLNKKEVIFPFYTQFRIMLFKVMFWILSGTVIVISREPYIVRFKTVLTFYMLLYE